MIKKLDVMKDTRNVIDKGGIVHTVANFTAIEKINELVDTINTIQKERETERFEIQEWIGILEAVRKSVNFHEKQIDELQMKLEPHKCEPAENSQIAKIAQGFKNLQDPFAKQRGWVGKLCKFKCASGYCYGLLTNIKRKPCKCPFEALGRAFSTCEPVKPDDDIIYKGE